MTVKSEYVPLVNHINGAHRKPASSKSAVPSANWAYFYKDRFACLLSMRVKQLPLGYEPVASIHAENGDQLLRMTGKTHKTREAALQQIKLFADTLQLQLEECINQARLRPRRNAVFLSIRDERVRLILRDQKGECRIDVYEDRGPDAIYASDRLTTLTIPYDEALKKIGALSEEAHEAIAQRIEEMKTWWKR